MGERRNRLGFTLEPGERVGIGCDGLGENFDRDVAIQLLIPRPVDLPHPARAKGHQDLVGAETGPRLKCHRMTGGEDSMPRGTTSSCSGRDWVDARRKAGLPAKSFTT